MAVKYKIIQRAEPGVTGGGTLKYYLTSIRDDIIDFEELIEEVSALSTVNGADVSAVLYGLVEMLTKLLSRGHSIELGGLGFLRVNISSSGTELEEDAHPSMIRKAYVHFRPGSKVRKMLKSLEFEKA